MSLTGPDPPVPPQGAPEALVKLCEPASVPGRFQDVLDWYTGQGLRVVGLACRPLSPHLGLAQVCPGGHY